MHYSIEHSLRRTISASGSSTSSCENSEQPHGYSCLIYATSVEIIAHIEPVAQGIRQILRRIRSVGAPSSYCSRGTTHRKVGGCWCAALPSTVSSFWLFPLPSDHTCCLFFGISLPVVQVGGGRKNTRTAAAWRSTHRHRMLWREISRSFNPRSPVLVFWPLVSLLLVNRE
jgi:hypothetical protein